MRKCIKCQFYVQRWFPQNGFSNNPGIGLLLLSPTFKTWYQSALNSIFHVWHRVNKLSTSWKSLQGSTLWICLKIVASSVNTLELYTVCIINYITYTFYFEYNGTQNRSMGYATHHTSNTIFLSNPILISLLLRKSCIYLCKGT